MVELSQSFSDMPARRAAASALSRTVGSMPSTLHDTREFMISSGCDSGAILAPSLPARPDRKTIEFGAGRLPQNPTFSLQGKYRVKECGAPAVKLKEPSDLPAEMRFRDVSALELVRRLADRGHIRS